LETIGLRYFNVFGPRQDPEGAYAAVIPKWIAALLDGHTVQINGDGETSRDFCHVANVVQGNVLAACRPMKAGNHAVYNIAVGKRTTLTQLFELIRSNLMELLNLPSLKFRVPEYREFRAGDVRHSLADISLAQLELSYSPTHDLKHGLRETIDWYVADHRRRSVADNNRRN
jgi:UDP-N-acetylglucosamine 4-epimerase